MKKNLAISTCLLALLLSCDQRTGDQHKDSKPTKCADIRPLSQEACQKADAIPGKKCYFMTKACVDDTEELAFFMSEHRSFVSNIKGQADKHLPAVPNADVWGHGHGEQPDWEALCGSEKAKHLTGLRLSFQQHFNNVKLSLNCGETANETNINKSYDLVYSVETLANGELAIKLYPNGNDVKFVAKVQKPQWWTGNQLEFFTKATWFLDTQANELIGVSVLQSREQKEFKNLGEVKRAISFIEGKEGEQFFEVAPGVYGMIFRLHQ